MGGTSTTAASPADGIWAPARRVLTVGLVLAVTFVAFEALAVATILPVVGRHLGDLRLYGWVFSAFLLASLVGIVVAGTLADRVQLGQPMLAGLALFALGLVIGGTAPDMAVLVAGRAVQGLGAGVVPAVAYVAISRCYPGTAWEWRWRSRSPSRSPSSGSRQERGCQDSSHRRVRHEPEPGVTCTSSVWMALLPYPWRFHGA